MGFSGIADENVRAAIIGFMRSLSDDPLPLTIAGLAVELGGRPPSVGRYVEGLNPIVFRRLQAFDGEGIYNGRCAGCHGISLTGRDTPTGGPALLGEAFDDRWFGGSVFELYDYIRREMTAEGGVGITHQDYAAIVAYILLRNGFAMGDDWLGHERATLENKGFFQY